MSYALDPPRKPPKRKRKNNPNRNRRLSPYSRLPALVNLDRRTKEAQLIKNTRAELLGHLGGSANVVQAALIEQAVQIKLRLAVMDRRFAETGTQTEHDSRTYLAWANSYSRMLAKLGIAAPKGHPTGLTEYLTKKAASEPHTASGASVVSEEPPTAAPVLARHGGR